MMIDILVEKKKQKKNPSVVGLDTCVDYLPDDMREDIATFDDDGGAYHQNDAEGFINLFGLPIKVKALLDEKKLK